MAINQLQQELVAIAGVPDTGIFAAVVGQTQNFLTIVNVVDASSVTLTRKPAGSAAVVTSGSITFDLPGIYLVTVAVAGASTRNITVCVWPAATLGTRVASDGRTLTMTALFGAMADPRFSVTAAEAALEVTNCTPDRWTQVWNSGSVVWSQYS